MFRARKKTKLKEMMKMKEEIFKEQRQLTKERRSERESELCSILLSKLLEKHSAQTLIRFLQKRRLLVLWIKNSLNSLFNVSRREPFSREHQTWKVNKIIDERNGKEKFKLNSVYSENIKKIKIKNIRELEKI
jgi:hypothetical protein